jgi:hypothetical protein
VEKLGSRVDPRHSWTGVGLGRPPLQALLVGHVAAPKSRSSTASGGSCLQGSPASRRSVEGTGRRVRTSLPRARMRSPAFVPFVRFLPGAPIRYGGPRIRTPRTARCGHDPASRSRRPPPASRPCGDTPCPHQLSELIRVRNARLILRYPLGQFRTPGLEPRQLRRELLDASRVMRS